MKALVYHGPKKVSVDTVPDAKIEKLTDAVIKLTTSNICGSDLHMYEGRTDVEKGKILGHENLGEVVEVGKAVDTVKKGDKVVSPFNIAGLRELRTRRHRLLPDLRRSVGNAPPPLMDSPAWGHTPAARPNQHLRVSYADFNCLQLPEDASVKEKDYVMLSDIFPSGWRSKGVADLKPSSSTVQVLSA